MKGFKKDGKFRPTGSKSKSPLRKKDVVDSTVWYKKTKEEMQPFYEKMKARSDLIKNNKDPYTGEPLEPHEEDEWWLKHTGHMYRSSNKKGWRYDDRGREEILDDKTKRRIKEEIPFLKFAKDPYNSTKQLCGQIMCDNQSEAGVGNAYAQFKITSIDEAGHTEGLLYGHKVGDTVCAGCLREVAFHGVDWEDENMRNPPKEDEEYRYDDEMDRAYDDYDLPDFDDAEAYKKPFEIKVLGGDVTLEYRPNGFEEKEDDYDV